MGAGRIDVGESSASRRSRSTRPPANFFALGNDPVNAVHLNIPSINAPVMPGRLITTRVLTNVSGRTEQVPDVGDDVRPARPSRSRRAASSCDPFESATITITIESHGDRRRAAVRHRRHLQSNRGADLHLPVAFIHTQGVGQPHAGLRAGHVARGGQSACKVEAAEQLVRRAGRRPATRSSARAARSSPRRERDSVNPRQARLHDVTLAGRRLACRPSIRARARRLHPAGPVRRARSISDRRRRDRQPQRVRGIRRTTVRRGTRSASTPTAIWSSAAGAQKTTTAATSRRARIRPRPNNILAPFWTDLDGTGAPGIFADVLHRRP